MDKIIKYGLVIIRDGKLLINRKKGTNLFLLPGGKPKKGESVINCLIREIKEEHKVRLIKEGISLIGEYEDIAANEPNTLISIRVYGGDIKDEPVPSSEIEEQRWFGIKDNTKILSPVLKNYILPELIRQGLIK